MQLKIAVISDFHCHNKKKNQKIQESYILTDENFGLFQDPFKSLEYLISRESEMKADLLLMLGDLTNKADLSGLTMGWDITKKIGQLLKVGCIIPNVGNHDVDSRKKLSDDPFRDIKSFSTDFPFQDGMLKEQFWRDGFIIREEEHFRVLVINTVHNHTDADEALHGLVSQEAINQIEESLSAISDNKLNIAICHHNPIEHSHYATGSRDFMYNGDELLSILDRYNFDLIIHGHKHDARIRYAPGGSNPPVVFSSGSFSAYSSLLLQGAYNTFHIITFDISESRLGRGIIETWFFVPTKGWKQGIKSEFFESIIGFGARLDLRETANEIAKWFAEQSDNTIEFDVLVNAFPDIKYLIPSDFAKLKNKLKQKQIWIGAKEMNEPIYIHYKRVS